MYKNCLIEKYRVKTNINWGYIYHQDLSSMSCQIHQKPTKKNQTLCVDVEIRIEINYSLQNSQEKEKLQFKVTSMLNEIFYPTPISLYSIYCHTKIRITFLSQKAKNKFLPQFSSKIIFMLRKL